MTDQSAREALVKALGLGGFADREKPSMLLDDLEVVVAAQVEAAVSVVRAGAPRVEINQPRNAPAECRVWIRDRLVFDGVSRSALLASSPAEGSGEAIPQAVWHEWHGDAPAPVSSDSTDIPNRAPESAFDADDSPIIAPVSSGEAGERVPCLVCGKPVKMRAHGFPRTHQPPDDYQGIISGDGKHCVGGVRFHSMNPYERRPAPVVTPSAEDGA